MSDFSDLMRVAHQQTSDVFHLFNRQLEKNSLKGGHVVGFLFVSSVGQGANGDLSAAWAKQCHGFGPGFEREEGTWYDLIRRPEGKVKMVS